jgi:LacI family transcriptional regulator
LTCSPWTRAATLTGRRVDGIVWAVHEIDDNHAWVTDERLAQLPPIVFLAMEPRPGLDVVGADNRRGAALATEHLIRTGRRNIGVITGPLTWWEARERLSAWRAAMHAHDLPANARQIIEGDWSAASGERALVKLLDAFPELDAVFAGNDQMALGVLRAAHTLGRRVPDDLAVVGYDNIPEAAYFLPSLTSVRQHLIDVGRHAVERLHTMVTARVNDAPLATDHVQLTMPELIVRESSG